jgi:CHASE2 domain-containing sensor protein
MGRMEPTEMQEFAKQMKEGGEESLTRISLAISILAAFVAIVTVMGHRSHTEAVLMEAKAADQWNLYEAKKIRQDSLMVTVDQMALLPTVDAKASAAKLAEYKSHIAKWTQDLKEAQDAANEYEAEVRRAEARAVRFDLGEALLQISVVLSAITLFTRRRTYFVGGLTLGVIGVVIAASAWLVR